MIFNAVSFFSSRVFLYGLAEWCGGLLFVHVAFVGLGSRSFTGIPPNLHLHSILGPLLFRPFFFFSFFFFRSGMDEAS